MSRLGLVLALGAVTTLLLTPATSPFALDQANAAYLAHDGPRAAALYAQIAAGWGSRATRSVAGERAALLALEAGDPKSAVHWLRVAIPLAGAEDRARLQERLAFVYTSRFGDGRRAAVALSEAATSADAAGNAPEALNLRVEAARAFGAAEAWEDASEAWNEVLPQLTDPTARQEAEAALLRAAAHLEEGSE